MSTTDVAPVDADERQVVEAAVDALIAGMPDPSAIDHAEVLVRRFDAGLAWVQNARGEGGLGVAPELQELVEDRLYTAGLLEHTDQRSAQRGLFAPVFVRFGTPEQRARFLRGIFTDEETWCLLLSEPGAGSDLGSASTNAQRDGDQWILNGQKVWTSRAHIADFGLILARHDRDAPKHKGLTAFVVDMKHPGVDVRPIRQMTGDAEFNEVFFTDVTVPDAHRVGDLGEGWTVMMSAIANERFIIGHDITVRDAGPLAEAVAAWRAAGSDDPVARDRISRLWIEGEAIRQFSLRSLEAYQHGRAGSESTMLKLRFTQFLQDVYEFIVDIQGPEGVLYTDDFEFHVYDDLTMDGHDPRRNFLAARSRTIGGGTSEILLTNIGERVLGLPREPKPSGR